MSNKSPVFYRVSDAANLVGITATTLRKYVKQGRLKAEYNPAGQRLFTIQELAKLRPELLSDESNMSTAYYVRSSDGKDVLLDTQVELLTKKYGKPDYIIKDKASGLNDNRKGLARLLSLAKKHRISRVCITEQDRLTRFGYKHLECLFNEYNVEIIVLGNTKTKSPQEELIQDFLSLLASFSGKYYRLRGHEQKKKFLIKTREELDQ